MDTTSEIQVYYKCKDCGYRFTRLSSFKFSGICFVCGKHNVEILPDKGTTMIKEISTETVRFKDDY